MKHPVICGSPRVCSILGYFKIGIHVVAFGVCSPVSECFLWPFMQYQSINNMLITQISLWTVALEKFFPLSSKIFQCGDLKHWYPFSLKLLSFTKLFLMFRTVWIRKIEGHMISHKSLTAEELLIAFIKLSFIFWHWYGYTPVGPEFHHSLWRWGAGFYSCITSLDVISFTPADWCEYLSTSWS